MPVAVGVGIWFDGATSPDSSNTGGGIPVISGAMWSVIGGATGLPTNNPKNNLTTGTSGAGGTGLVIVSATGTATPTPILGPTDTPRPTDERPTDTPTPTEERPTDTPTPTEERPTDTPVPSTDTPVPPTDTPVPPTDTPVPTDTPDPSVLKLGNLVFFDFDNDGIFEPVDGDYPIDHVALNLYEDLDSSGDLSAGDGAPIDSTTTASDMYMFSIPTAGEYIVEIAASNFAAGGALFNLISSTGNDILGQAPDPDDDVDNDDNGTALVSSIASSAITLDFGTEPPVGVDGNDTNGNFTLDFGVVRQATPTGVDFSDFSADLVSAAERKVAVAWETRNEQDIAGFNVFRTDLAKPFDSQRVNVDLVAAEGSRNGRAYRLGDTLPGDGEYVYLIEVVLLDGSSWRHGPAHLRLPGAIWLPALLSQDDLRGEVPNRDQLHLVEAFGAGEIVR